MKFFKKQKKANALVLGQRPESFGQPLHDWRIILVSFAVLVLVVISVDGYLFWRINQGDFFTTEAPPEVSVSASNGKILLDANTYFDQQQKDYAAFVASPPAETDPSL